MKNRENNKPRVESSEPSVTGVGKKRVLTPAEIASRQLAHEIKVQEFLAGGKR